MKRSISMAAIALLPVLAFASLEDPIEKRVLTPINPHSYAQGLCPGFPLKQIPAIDQSLNSPKLDVTVRIQQDLEFQLAMNAANIVYDLPDLETVKTGQELVDQVKPFLRSLPKGYEPYAYISEPEAGMKYMILSPSKGARANAPWVLAIAGTQSFLDIMADLNLGWSQLQKVSRLAGLFTSCQHLDSNQKPMASRRWIFTGHSLGGGLAQAFAYKIQRERLTNLLSPVDLQLITFNGFGAQELVKQDGIYNPNVSKYFRVKNFFVKGDPISRIGTHVGPTFELTVSDTEKDLLTTPMDLYRYHSMESVLNIANAPHDLLSALSLAVATTPPPLKAVQPKQLIEYTPLFRKWPSAIYKNQEEKFVEILQEAADYVLTLDQRNPENQKTLQYVKRLILARISNSSTAAAQSLRTTLGRLAINMKLN